MPKIEEEDLMEFSDLFTELKRYCKAFGVRVPRRITTLQGLGPFEVELLGLDRVGTGTRREYTSQEVRMLVSWILTEDFMGGRGQPNCGLEKRREVAKLLATNEGGFVCSNANRVWHTDTIADQNLEGLATLIFTVPDWSQ